MSDHSPVKPDTGKEIPALPSTSTGSGYDVERGDAGIKFQSAPLARELKGRHMQMIALGTLMLLTSAA